jgi:flagellar P-ring protein precursor FlgI
MRMVWVMAMLAAMALPLLRAEDSVRRQLVRDVVSVEGVRENPLLGYGMVVGLNGTGDRRQTMFTTQTLANVLERMGVQIAATQVRVNNVAAVMVTASLPAFARPGSRLDVTVSSIGDAKSLEGGLLLLTPLRAADGEVYAAAQGPVAVGGYSAGVSGNSKQVNHPTVGRVPNGGTVERDAALDLDRLPRLALLLREPDFSTAESVAAAINSDFKTEVAAVVDGRRVDIDRGRAHAASVPALLARVENLTVTVHRRAKVVVNERTGTVVMGKEVRLGAVSVLHGGLTIAITTDYSVSQPAPFSNGKTTTVAQPSVEAQESAARHMQLGEGASVEQLVNGLQTMGATARDVIAILQAIKAAGALDADLEVI